MPFSCRRLAPSFLVKMDAEWSDEGQMDVGMEGAPSLKLYDTVTPVKRVSEVDVASVKKSLPAVGGMRTPKSWPGKMKSTKIKRLFVKEKRSQPPWTLDETKYLIYFLMLHTDGKSWVVHKDYHFWDEAGAFIQLRVHSPHKRSGTQFVCTTF